VVTIVPLSAHTILFYRTVSLYVVFVSFCICLTAWFYVSLSLTTIVGSWYLCVVRHARGIFRETDDTTTQNVDNNRPYYFVPGRGAKGHWTTRGYRLCGHTESSLFKYARTKTLINGLTTIFNCISLLSTSIWHNDVFYVHIIIYLKLQLLSATSARCPVRELAIRELAFPRVVQLPCEVLRWACLYVCLFAGISQQELRRCSDGRPFGHNRHGPKSGGCCAPFRGELGPHLTQCRLGWGLPPYQVASWSI